MSGSFSRARPSPRYQELIALYRSMHEDGDAEEGIEAGEMFAGQSLVPRINEIKILLAGYRVRTLLDYGSGKGRLYADMKIDAGGDVHESLAAYWGVERIACYDPAFPPLATLPAGPFDAVVCTDVLEHCPEVDLSWIVDELFSLARCLVYANVACYPARKTLPGGENAHITQRPPEWWAALFQAAADPYPNIHGRVVAALEPGEESETVVVFER